ncbi:MAG TPA: AI-2E family transporter, partial [Longimicrobiaceae bacterium]
MTTPPGPDTPKETPASPETTPPAPDAPLRTFQERRARAVGWHSKDIVRAAALVIAMYLATKLLWFAHALVFVAFLGVLFGLAVEAGVDRLERFRIRRGIGAAIIVLGFFGLLTGFGAAMAPTVREQSRELRVKIPEAVDKLQDWVERKRGGMLGMFLGGPDTAAGAGATTGATTSATTGATTAAGSGAAAPDTVVVMRDTSQAATRERLSGSLGRQFSGATRYLFPFLSQTFAVVAGILLIIFMSIYIAADPGLYHRGLMHLFPHRARNRAGEVLSAIATVLRRWLVTQLIAMVAIGTVTTIALLILDVEAAFALGLIAGLLEFIPTIGPILSAVPAIAMAFLDTPEKALTVAAVYVGIQFLENHLLIPMLMKGGVDVPPILTILGQALFTLLFGFLGLMVAVPVLAAVMVMVKMLYVEGVV